MVLDIRLPEIKLAVLCIIIMPLAIYLCKYIVHALGGHDTCFWFAGNSEGIVVTSFNLNTWKFLSPLIYYNIIVNTQYLSHGHS